MHPEPKSMIAVLGGTGKEGSGLALRWASAGHHIVIGSRSRARAQETAGLDGYVGRQIDEKHLPGVAIGRVDLTQGVTGKPGLRDRFAFAGNGKPGRKIAPPAPRAFVGLLGEYGPDAHKIYILERDGRLTALIDHSYYPLRKLTANVFQFAKASPYEGAKVAFTPDTVTICAGVFHRRPTGPGTDGIYRIQPLRPVADLRREAMA